VSLEAFLPPFEHRLLHSEIAQVLSSIDDEIVFLLLLLLIDLYSDHFFVHTALHIDVCCVLLLAHQVTEVALLEHINRLKLGLAFNDFILLLRSVCRRDVLKSHLTSH